MSWYQVHPDGITLTLRIQPRASRNSISGLLGDALKIALTAPPVDGEANQACVKFLASFFKVSLRDVKLESGQTSRTKRIRILGLHEAEMLEKIGPFLKEN